MIGREKRKDKRDIGKVKGNENTDKDERQRRDEDGKREGEGKKKTGTEGREKVGGCAGGKGGGARWWDLLSSRFALRPTPPAPPFSGVAVFAEITPPLSPTILTPSLQCISILVYQVLALALALAPAPILL